MALTNEPFFKGLIHSKTDIGKALNYYSVEASYDDLRGWAIKYMQKNHPDLVKKLQKLRPYDFITWGAVCRMSERGFVYDDAMKQRIFDHFNNLEVRKKDVDSDVTPVTNRGAAKTTFFKHATKSREQFEKALDDVMSGKTATFQVVPGDKTDDILQVCNRELGDIEQAPDYFLPKTIKLLKAFLTSVKTSLEKTAAIKKAQLKPVHRKANPAKQVRDVQYKIKDEEAGVRSIQPIDVLEKSKVYVYDAKYRKLIVFNALTSAGLQFAGTTLKNADLNNSFSKTIRKPKEFFENTALNIASLNKAFNSLKTKPTKMAASRFNKNWVILKATEKYT